MNFSGNILEHVCKNIQFTQFTKKTLFFWTEIHEKEFLDMENAITSPECMLLHPDWSSEFELHVDASKKGIGVMLTQWKAKTCKICVEMFYKV